MLGYKQRPDTRVILAIIVAAFLVVVAASWALRAGRVRSATDPTPAPLNAPGPAGVRNPVAAPPAPAPR
jgi:hypothetical protein